MPSDGLYHNLRLKALSTKNNANRAELNIGMFPDSSTLSPDALDRIYPIRSVIEIEPPSSDTVSLSSRGQRIVRDHDTEDTASTPMSDEHGYQWSAKVEQNTEEVESPFVTTRFTHKATEDGHMVVTGVAGAEQMQKCEDEPIHAPGAVQGFGALLALHELVDHTLKVRIASENSREIISYTPAQLFALNDFCEILSEEQTEEFYENLEFVRSDTRPNPEVFSLHIIAPDATVIKLWCALSIHQTDKDMIICEFEPEEDSKHPIVPLDDTSPAFPTDTLKSNPTPEDIAESTHSVSRPLRILKRARQSRGEIAELNVYRLTSQIQEQFGAAESMDQLLKIVVGVVKELTKFHRVMVYHFDSEWNGKVITELVDITKTKDLYKGLYFPASDIPKQARELYRINKVRLLYDRDLPTARLVCKSAKDLETPLDMTHSYLRAMSPIHLKYLENMDVRASMSISITCNGKLWGLIACHSYGAYGMRVTFPLRNMCMIVGEAASRNVERLTDTSKLQARRLINAVPAEQVPSGYIAASSDDLLKLFDADFGILSINNETKLMGKMIASQEALALLEYLRIKRFQCVVACQHITGEHPDLKYPPGFQTLGGFLLVPLSGQGADFIVFLRRWQLKQVHWAGNPYEKQEIIGHLMPRKSFRIWVETVRGKCSEWTEDQVETAAVLCLVYGKFIEVWRQKEAAIQTSQMTKILLANASHELRTPLNAIINFMEIALEGPLDKETRDNLSRSHVASKSLIYAINDLLDLTRTEQGQELVKEEDFNLIQTVRDTVSAFSVDIEKKGLMIDVIVPPNFPVVVRSDEMKMRQCISNLLSNAVKYTDQGGITVELRIVSIREAGKVDIEIAVQDTGIGMNAEEMDILFKQLEKVQADDELSLEAQNDEINGSYMLTASSTKKVLGLGIAKVGRIIQNIGGQLRVASEKGKGSRFTMQIPLSIPVSPSLGNHAFSVRTPTSGSGMGVTLVEFQSNQTPGPTQSPQRPQFSRRTSCDSPPSSRPHSASELNRLVRVMQNIVPNAKTPFSGAFDESIDKKAFREELEKAASDPVVHHRLAKRASQPNLPRVLEVLNPVEEASNNIARPKDIKATIRPPIKTSTSPNSPLKPVFDGKSTTGKQAFSVTSPPRNKVDTKKSLSILVAEDDPINSLIIKKRMERMGYSVKLTVNGQQCADTFKSDPKKYDLVLMDMQMPIVDGGEATALIRQHELLSQDSAWPPGPYDSFSKRNRRRIPIFAISASLVENKRLEYMETGFDGWLLKPVDFKRLQILICGIEDLELRKEEKYKPGKWGIGGWLLPEPGDGDESKSQAISIGRKLSITPGGWPFPESYSTLPEDGYDHVDIV